MQADWLGEESGLEIDMLLCWHEYDKSTHQLESQNDELAQLHEEL